MLIVAAILLLVSSCNAQPTTSRAQSTELLIRCLASYQAAANSRQKNSDFDQVGDSVIMAASGDLFYLLDTCAQVLFAGDPDFKVEAVTVFSLSGSGEIPIRMAKCIFSARGSRKVVFIEAVATGNSILVARDVDAPEIMFDHDQFLNDCIERSSAFEPSGANTLVTYFPVLDVSSPAIVILLNGSDFKMITANTRSRKSGR